MTKVELRYKLGKMDPESLARLSGLASIYGILRIAFQPQTNDLLIEYDATRLQEKDVKAALGGAGIPLVA